MAEPYFHRNVVAILHDEARSWETKLGTILCHAISTAQICSVTDRGRALGRLAVGQNYGKTWRLLKTFNEICLPLWIECQIGPDSQMGMLVLKTGNSQHPTFIMRRFTMKNDVVVQPLFPVVTGWSHKQVVGASARLPIGNFVTTQNLCQDQKGISDVVPEATQKNALMSAALTIGILATMKDAGSEHDGLFINVPRDARTINDNHRRLTPGPDVTRAAGHTRSQVNEDGQHEVALF